MAWLCNACGIVHIQREQDCEQNRQMVVLLREKLNHDITHHLESCRGCPDPRRHLENLDRLDNPDSWKDRKLRSFVS